MKKCLLFYVFLFTSAYVLAQQDAWVYFTDKPNVQTSIANPITILTQKAIDRKNAHGVSIDARDVPVNETYISQLKNATGITVKAKSKWFNAVHVRGSVTDINNLKTTFSFVDKIVFADRSLNVTKTVKQKQASKLQTALTTFNYGNATNQIQMIKGDQLHVSNYTGTGITVAVLDAGFPNVNTMASFQRLRNAGNLKGSYDFVQRDIDVYTNTTSHHGTLVLSTMAGYVENQFVGTAPDASYYLFITEDAPTENPVEESYWVEAAERADSLGVDVINTSLGYTTYDNANYSYTTSDMDGNTAFITKGANIAFEKGMLLINSAGNEGNSSWGIVSAPADAAGVLTVGAVNSLGNYASFSSRGSSIQSTQKPDVVAQGQASAVIDENDVIYTANGTSFSSPILAGAVACLWQALPNKSNAEIMQLVRESASQYNTPDYYLGFGIPNLQTALNMVLSMASVDDLNEIKLYPNPANNMVAFTLPSTQQTFNVTVYSVSGTRVLESTINSVNNQLHISSLSKGMYFIDLKSASVSKTFKIIKQ